MPKSNSSSNLKLHCLHCGKKRLMALTLPFPKEDGKMGIVFLKIRNLYKLIKEGKLPNTKGAEFPKEGLMGKCLVCNNVTFFDLNKNNKLSALL